MQLKNKVIVLTGGSSGVGLALLRQLAPHNTVINLSRREPDVPVDDPRANIVHVPTDLSEASDVARAVERVKAQQPGGIDGLINCAAMQVTPRFADPDFDPASIAVETRVNFISPVELMAGLLGSLSQRPGSFILNVNSGLALAPKRESAVYCATKAGLDNASRALAAQLGSSGPQVMQVFLPLVDTPMTAGRGSGKLESADVARRIIRGVEQGRAVNDVGKVRLFRAINRLSPSLAARIMQRA